ncbi:MAG TPA: hypothetical protein VK684_05300, partial [Edaphobacter sp.]|nr:hypothetical protein [Edaphobacter sp.]
AQFQMRIGSRVLAVLARLMEEMGEAEFAAAWRHAFEGEEPPLDTLRGILETEETPTRPASGRHRFARLLKGLIRKGQ